MSDKPLNDEQIRSIEKEIDAGFLETLGLSGIWKSTLRDYALDITEELLTGHGTIDDISSRSLMTYFLNVVNGCNVLLRQIEAVGSDMQTELPTDLELRMKRAIAAASLYSTVEDAYTSYSRGYATAVLAATNTIRFDPLGGELDARLRFFGSVLSPSDRIANSEPPRFQVPDLMAKEHEERMVSTLVNSKLEQMGGLSYTMDKSLLRDVAEGYRVYFTSMIEMPMDTGLGRATLDGVVRAYSVLWAAAHLHKWVTILSTVPEMAKSVNWPTLFRPEAEWKDMLTGFCPADQVDAIIDIFRFDPRRPDADISLTPLVDLGEGYLALSPTAILHSNFPRNVLVLLIRKFPKEYSAYTSGREKVLAAAAKEILGVNWIAAGVSLPKWKGRQLPDIDLLIKGTNQNPLLLCEVKWQLSGSSTREVINRDEYLKKGLRQLEAIREFLAAHPLFLQERNLIDRPTEPKDLEFLLLCKGHLGSETIQSEGILKCDYDVFLRDIVHQGSEHALELARKYSYLPKLGIDFTVEPKSVRFGRWRLSWWSLLPTGLPADDESEAVLDFYNDTVEFMR